MDIKRWVVVFAGAIALFLTIAMPVLPQPTVSPESAEQLLQQGNTQYQAGQQEAAVQSWQRALELYRQGQDTNGAARVLTNLSATFVSLERYKEAVTTLEAYLPIARSLPDRLSEAQALSNLGIAYDALGKYGQALEAHRQAGRLMRSLNNQPGLGQVLLNLGNVFEAVGDYDSAQIAFQQSLNIVQQTGDRVGETIALNNLGAIYTNLGDYDRAIQTFEISLALARSNQNFSSQASTLVNLGSAYHALSIDPKKRATYLKRAIDAYQQALTTAQKAGDRRREGEALGSLGLAYEDLKQYPRAINYHRKSLAIAHATDNIEAEGIALNNLGHALFGAGQLAAAETQLRQTLQLLDSLRPDLNDTYKVSIFDTQVHSYNLLQQILVAAKKYNAALEVTEQGRARAFAELLAKRLVGSGKGGQGDNRKDDPSPSPPPPTIQQIRQIARQQNTTLVEYAIVPDDAFKFRGKQRARESDLFIWVVSPLGRVSFRRVDLKPLWQKQATLTDVVQVARCLVPGDDCGAIAKAIREVKLGGKTPPPKPSLPSSDQAPAPKQTGLRKLHEALVQPIADLLPTDPAAHITLIPQDSLFLVPFAALQDANGTYLIEQHTLLTAPSIQVLALTQQQRDEGRGMKQNNSPLSSPIPHPPSFPSPSLIVGNPTMPTIALSAGQEPTQLAPLPESEKEAIEIARLLQTQAITGDAATKAAIVQQLPTAQLVHLATHGLLEYGTGAGKVSLQGLGVPGAIALAPSGQDSGLLTANEIVDLPLQAQLVVLSACNTGQGRVTGDGVIGLSRAFMTAGVPSVLVSLWAVPDTSTAHLMTAFYQNLLQQPDKARALRQAMLDTLRDYPYPLDWAAFTLIGQAE